MIGPEPTFTIVRADEPHAAVFRVSGDLDVLGAGQLARGIEPLLEPDAEIVIDLADVGFLDDLAALRLRRLHARAVIAAASVRLTGASKLVASALATAGVPAA